MKTADTKTIFAYSKIRLLLFCGSCFLFFFLIMLCAPYTYDDYEFARVPYDSFRELISFCLTYGNGRLLGNIFGIVLNQHPVLGAAVKSLFMSGTVILLPAVCGLRSKHAYLLSFLLVTAIDPALFAQIYTWTSGFGNYAPPVCLTLLILWLIQQYPEEGSAGKKTCVCIALFFIGLAAQLYIEHSSIINLVLALFLAVKAWFTPKKHGLLPAFILILATTAGLILMFWIPAHFIASANNHTTGYRSLYVDSIATFIFNCARNALRLTNHYFGLCGVPLCAGAALTVYLTRENRKEKWNTLLYAGGFIPLIYMAICSLLNIEGWYAEPAIIHHAIAMIMVLSGLMTWIIALFGMKDRIFRNRIWVLLGFAVFSMLPLLIVTPIRIRVLYHSQIFVVMAFLLCLCRWMSGWTGKTIALTVKALCVTAVVMVLTLGSVFISIRSMAQARHTYTMNQLSQGETAIDFFRIPYSYVHDDTDSGMGDYYYINSPRDVEFMILPFDQWMNDFLDSVK